MIITFKHMPSENVPLYTIKSTVGAGDSFLGGFIYGLLKDEDIRMCIGYGQKCAVKSLSSDRNVSDEVKESML